MATFIMLTCLMPGAFRSPERLEKLEKEVMTGSRRGLPGPINGSPTKSCSVLTITWTSSGAGHRSGEKFSAIVR